jgi:hypothetical protein
MLWQQSQIIAAFVFRVLRRSLLTVFRQMQSALMLQEHRKRRRHLLFAAVFLLAQTINRYRAEYFLQATDTTDLFDEYCWRDWCTASV